MIKVLFVHDDSRAREGLRRILQDAGDMDVVDEAADPAEAVKKLSRLKPDVIVLDASTPGMADFGAINRRCPHDAQIPLVILTRRPQPRTAARLVRSGALGFVVSRSASAELAEAVRTVHGGRPYVSGHLKAALDQARREEREIPQRLSRLTKRELQVLCQLAAGESNREIAQALVLSPKTVSTHRMHILAKLRLRNNVELARFAIEHNLLDS